MEHLSKELLENRGLHSRSVAFDRQLPLGTAAGTALGGTGPEIPEGAVVLPDGSVLFSMLAPGAETVILSAVTGEDIPMEKQADGIWTLNAKLPAGFNPVFFKVDGSTVMNPMAPIGFGWSKPINYVDVPSPAADFYLMKDVPHGSVSQEFYYSSATGGYESCLVYLPPCYHKSDREYPVLYLQHGHGENEQCWVHQGKVNFIMDNLLAEGQAEPCIIVMNNGMVQREADGKRMLDTVLIEKLLLDDCIPFIEGRFRAKKDNQDRAMAGLSMGSMQTSYVTLRNPGTFAWAGIFSGFLRMRLIGDLANPHMAALDDPEMVKRSFKLFFRAVGTGDHVYEPFQEEDGIMAAHGLSPAEWSAHKVMLYEGGHDWNVWRMTARDFLQLIFR